MAKTVKKAIIYCRLEAGKCDRFKAFSAKFCEKMDCW